ncbi:hypothetical protein ACFLTH_17620 [Bacteroidota bacterium]
MDYSKLEEMLSKWEKSTREYSGNLTTNEYLPPEIKRKLLNENLGLVNELEYEEMLFPPLCQELDDIKGMDILSGLQKVEKEENLTVYRAIRFPTVYRTWKTVSELGLSMPNYEQERILQLYGEYDYVAKRNETKKDPNFWTQPQERVVNGVPVFCLVNDALQIHRAYRSERDRVLMVAIHVPKEVVKSTSLVANTAIDLDYTNSERDFKIKDFKERDGSMFVDYRALRVRGIDLHEMYFNGLPFDLGGHKQLGIEQRFFLLDIYRIDPKDSRVKDLSSEVLKEHEYFLHGIFGDQNIFGRGVTRYLPFQCHEVRAKE